MRDRDHWTQAVSFPSRTMQQAVRRDGRRLGRRQRSVRNNSTLRRQMLAVDQRTTVLAPNTDAQNDGSSLPDTCHDGDDAHALVQIAQARTWPRQRQRSSSTSLRLAPSWLRTTTLCFALRPQIKAPPNREVSGGAKQPKGPWS